MISIDDIEAGRLIEKASEELKKLESMMMPGWARFVRTGVGQDRIPEKQDWWYNRAASMLRKVYLLGTIGVNKLTGQYQKRKNRGYKPERVYRASGKIIRVILQQLEASGFLEKKNIKDRKGRALTPKGKKFLDQIAKACK